MGTCTKQILNGFLTLSTLLSPLDWSFQNRRQRFLPRT
jgi:hypothetical protein